MVSKSHQKFTKQKSFVTPVMVRFLDYQGFPLDNFVLIPLFHFPHLSHPLIIAASLTKEKPDRERKTGHSSEFGMTVQCPVFRVFLP